MSPASPSRSAPDPPLASDAPVAAGVLSSAAIAFLPLLGAAGLTLAAAAADGTTFQDVVLLPPERVGALRFAAAIGAMGLGYLGVYFAPGLLLARLLRLRLPNPVAGAATAFALSLLGVSLAWSAAQAVTDGPAGRVCLYLTVAVVDAAALLAGVFLAPRAGALPRRAAATADAPHATTGRAELLVPVAGALLLLAAAWIAMPGKITVEALEGDATEVHGFASSLADGAVPSWDLENGSWGFYPTFVFVSYPVWFSLALGGDSEAAVRLPALLFLGVLVVISADLAGRGRARRAGASPAVLLPVLVVGYLSLQVGAYYAGYHPIHGDLGCSPLEEWIVTALAFVAMLLLRDGAALPAAVAAFLAVVSFPSGLLLVALIGAGGLALGGRAMRRVVLRAAAWLGALLLLYAAAVAIGTAANGSLGPMLAEWREKYFARRASFASESPARMVRALGWYALLAGGVPVLGYALAVRADRTARWMAAVGGLWTLFFLLSPSKNVHYFLPAALVPVAVAVRALVQEGRPLRARAAAAALVLSAGACIALCRPAPVDPYVADRLLGRRTYFLAGTYRQAVEYSAVIHNVMVPLSRWDPDRSWAIGKHTWVLYADRGFEPQRKYDFYVGEGPPPVPGLTELTRIALRGGRTVRLWSADGPGALREWKALRFARKRDLSRFSFEM